MADDRRPDWEYWKEIPNWTILEGVTLSMDRDPEDKQSNWAEFLGSTKVKKRLSAPVAARLFRYSDSTKISTGAVVLSTDEQ